MKLTRRFFSSLPFAALLSRTRGATALLAAAPPAAAHTVSVITLLKPMTAKEIEFYENKYWRKFREEHDRAWMRRSERKNLTFLPLYNIL
jgi:hypothetical protein